MAKQNWAWIGELAKEMRDHKVKELVLADGRKLVVMDPAWYEEGIPTLDAQAATEEVLESTAPKKATNSSAAQSAKKQRYADMGIMLSDEELTQYPDNPME